MTARILGVVLIAACNSSPKPPTLDEREARDTIAMLRSAEDAIRSAPDRAHLHDLVESVVIRERSGLVLCMAAAELRRVDVIVVAKIGVGGIASMRGFARQLDVDQAPVENDKVTKCFREELHSPAFPGVDGDALGGADYALVAFRPLLLGKQP